MQGCLSDRPQNEIGGPRTACPRDGAASVRGPHIGWSAAFFEIKYQDPLLYFHSSVLAVVDWRDGAASLNGCKAACLTGLKMKSEVPGLPARAMARLPFGDLTSAGVPPSLRSSIF